MANDLLMMQQALREAEKAAQKEECPIGAVAVCEDKIIARAHNLRESKHDPLGHAEILILQKLSKKLKKWRMNDVTLYVTLEPCLMCMGALIQARVGRLVFGTLDPKAGACGSLYDLSQDERLNHRIEVERGVLENESRLILKFFFKSLRSKKKVKLK